MRKRKVPLVLKYKCSKCGAIVNLDKYNPAHPTVSRMIKEGLCYHCAYWNRFLERKKRNLEIVGGKIYLFDKKYVFGNRKFNETRYIIHTQGDVKKLRKSFYIENTPIGYNIPDTGTFISQRAFRTMSNRNEKYCRAIGCYDRYHCMLYHPEITETNGPWNAIPKNYKVGGERCPSFLDKDIHIIPK